jgi:hypothetical protein
MGDFNFYRSTENRNRPFGDYNDILVFNSIISHLGLIDLPIKGRSFTWSNMQDSPVLEQIDWFFTSVFWTTKYPSTLVLPMARIISDHLPCKVQISIAIPKANIFRFENFWFSHPSCLQTISNSWIIPARQSNSAHIVSAKFKLLKKILKNWAKSISNLSKLIANCNLTIAFFDILEEFRVLFSRESRFRSIIKGQLQMLLRMQ